MITAPVATASAKPIGPIRSPPRVTPAENPALNPMRYHVNPRVRSLPWAKSAT